MRRSLAVLAAVLSLAACNRTPTNAAVTSSAPPALAAVDYAAWRVVEPGALTASLAMMCAGGLDDLGRADPTLHDGAGLAVPWSIQVTRKGKMQAQCVWTGPEGRTGRIVVDVLCKDEDDDRCSRFAYGVEGARKLEIGPRVRHVSPPISTAYPPGRDDIEQTRSVAILNWARDHAPDQIGALRAEFRGAKVGINADAKIPVLCGQVREAGKPWQRFAVYSTGGEASANPAFHWLRGKDVKDFCDVTDEDLQWYSVGDARM